MGDTFPLGAQLRYPITIKRLLYKPGDELKKGTTAVDFSYKYMRDVGDGTADETRLEEQTGYASWPSPVDGKLKAWKIKVGDVIKGDRPCAVIEEPCKHEVQFQGQCAYCGKPTDEVDWSTNRVATDRAPVRMTHDQANLTVSRERAAKTELLQQERLLKQRKLSLVVDLDQTIIHACIDPTVGEWQRDPTNPNYEAVKDVQSFQLNDDGPRGMASGCSYYIKMRPGLRNFLEKISQLYELHVYTMGTRAYAANIAKIVDPDKKLFGDRVISRDENGNMTAKNLQRLFPVSTNMVVIIDDRADVWPNNRPNLIKVVPYDFFKGVGDINSSFLPKREDILPPTEKPAQNGAPKQNGAGDTAKVSALEGLAGMSSGDDAALLKLQTEEQERALEKQLTDRPLLHMQEKLDKEDQDAEMGEAEDDNPVGEQTTPPHPQRHQVLFDDDNELKYLEHHLTVLHSKYYEAHKSHTDILSIPDVGEILDDLKSEVLRGTRIVLSGLVPQEVDPLRSEIGLQAMSYGADLQTRIHSGITHLVVSLNRPRTAKVRTAARIPSIKIVNQNWLQDSISQWQELDETPYLVHLHPADRSGLAPLAMPGQRAESTPDLANASPQNSAATEEGEDEDDDLDSAAEDDDDPRSPIEELKGFDFLGADEELDEFLADDSEDGDGDETSEGGDDKTESDFDDGASTRSGASTSSRGRVKDKDGTVVNGTLPPSKRKHGDTDSESEQEPASTGSALSKKLRISRQRGGSSLRSTYTVDAKTPKPDSSPNPPQQGQQQGQVNGSGGDDGDEEVDLLKADAGTNDGADDDLEADLEDELENELMAALNKEEQEALDEKG